MKKVLIIISIVMMGIIFLFSSCNSHISAEQSTLIVNWVSKIIPVNSFLIRKFAHFSLFFVLEIIIYYLCTVFSLKYPGLISTLFVSLYAISDEIHQYFVPGRSCELRDMLIDISGAVIALIILKLWR